MRAHPKLLDLARSLCFDAMSWPTMRSGLSLSARSFGAKKHYKLETPHREALNHFMEEISALRERA